MSGDYFLFLVVFVSLALIGFRKFMRNVDPEGKITTTTRDGIVGKIGKWLS